MSLTNLLRRTLVHYSRCGSHLTLPPLDLEAKKPNWAKNTTPFYKEDSFHPNTEPDPSYVSFTVLVQEDEDDTLRLIRADTGEFYHGHGMVFSNLSSSDRQGHVIEAWDKDHLVATVAVSEGLFRAVQPLRYLEDQFDALSQICMPFLEDYTAIETFLTDPAGASSLFYCLCFLASNLDFQMEWEDLNIPDLVDTFNQVFVSKLGIEPVSADAVLILLEELELPNLEIPENLYSILSFCALVHRCSIHQQESNSLVHAMYKIKEKYSSTYMLFLLQWCCDTELIRKIVTEALFLLPRSNSRREFCEKLLLLCLASEIPLDNGSIEEICTKMFCDELSQVQRDWMSRILESPNGPYFQAFIRHNYLWMWDVGKYLQAMACIRSCCAEEKAVQLAQDLLLNSQEESETLLGAEMLIQHLQAVKVLPVTLTHEQQIRQKLAQWLLSYHSHTFATASRLTMAMKLTCSMDGQALWQEDILTSACQAFYEKDTQESAICLLSSMPLACTCTTIEEPGAFWEELEWLFREARNEANLLRTTALFRCCVIAGCWDRSQLLSNYRALVAAEYDHAKNLTILEKQFLVQTKEELFPLLFSGGVPTTEKAWDCLRGGLSNASKIRLEEILHAVNRQQTVVLNSSEDVMLVLRYLRIAGSEEHFQAAALANYCKLAEGVSDSCLVSWFWILCCWNHDQKAMEYYLAHKDLLDRPWRSSEEISLLRHWKNRGCKAFLNTDSRLLMGIYLAALLNNAKLVSQFLNSGVLDSRAVKAAEEVFTELSLCKLPKVLQFLSCSDLDTVENTDSRTVRNWILQCMLPLNPYEFWRIYWDDRGIARQVISYGSDHSRTILDLGYSGDKEIAMTAARFCHRGIHHIAPRFLKDDEIALAALELSFTSLQALQAPVVQDHELILSMIHQKQDYPPLVSVPDWLCNNKDFVIQSLRKHPTYFFAASNRLRADAEVLMTAMQALPSSERHFVCNLLQEADPSLRSNRQVMTCAVHIYPNSIRMAGQTLRTDPQLLAPADG